MKRNENILYTNFITPKLDNLVKAFNICPDFGHIESLSCLVLSPDMKYIISGSYDKTIRIREFPFGKLKKTLCGHKKSIYNLVISADGNFLISRGKKSIIVWEFPTGTVIRSMEMEESCSYKVESTLKGVFLVKRSRSNEKTVKIYDIISNKLISTINLPQETDHLTMEKITSDGKFYILISYNSVYFWDIESNKMIREFKREFQSEGYPRIDISSKGDFLIFIDKKDKINPIFEIWNLNLGQCLKKLKLEFFPGQIEDVYLSSNEKHALISYNDFNKSFSVRIFDLDKEQFIGKITTKGRFAAFRRVVTSADNKFIITDDWGGKIKVWDFKNLELVHLIEGGHPSTNGILFDITKDMKYFITNSYIEDQVEVTVWDFISGNFIKALTGFRSVERFFILPNTNYLIIQEHSGRTTIWDLTTLSLINELDIGEGFISSVTLTSDLRYVINGSYNDNLIKIRDFSTGEIVNSLHGHKGFVKTLNITSDSKYLISGSGDWSIRIWDLSSGNLIRKLKSHKGPVSCVDISHDDRLIVSGGDPGDQSVKVWDFSTGDLIHSFVQNNKAVTDVSFSPDDKLIATASVDRSIIIYHIDGKKMYGPFYHNSTIQHVKWVNEGKYIAAADYSGEIRVWDYKNEEKIINYDKKPRIRPQYNISNHHFCEKCISFKYMIKYFRNDNGKWVECTEKKAEIGMEFCDKCNSGLRVHDLDESIRRYYLWDVKSGEDFDYYRSKKIYEDIFGES